MSYYLFRPIKITFLINWSQKGINVISRYEEKIIFEINVSLIIQDLYCIFVLESDEIVVNTLSSDLFDSHHYFFMCQFSYIGSSVLSTVLVGCRQKIQFCIIWNVCLPSLKSLITTATRSWPRTYIEHFTSHDKAVPYQSSFYQFLCVYSPLNCYGYGLTLSHLHSTSTDNYVVCSHFCF